MLGFVRNLFTPRPGPIGVDLGTDTLRLAQCLHDGREWHLTAAACTDIPSGVRQSSETLTEFLIQGIRDLLTCAPFRGRDAVLCIPSRELTIQHIRMPKLDEQETRKALPWELKDKLPMDPSAAVLRHLIAGEVQVNNESKNEVVVMATPKTTVSHLLQLASRAKLNVIGMNVEPRAVVDCFAHVYRRRSDQQVTTCYVDIGAESTRVTIAHGTRILFARTIGIGGDHFSNRVAEQTGMDFEQAKLLRIKLASEPLVRPQPIVVPSEEPPSVDQAPSENHSFALLGLAPREDRRHQVEPVQIIPAVLSQDQVEQQRQVDLACQDLIHRLCEELNLCRRYCESTFVQYPVDRIIFLGGEARQRGLCQQIAQNLGLAAQLGDPLVRMGKTTEVGPESGIDPRQPQPAWAVALGLTMGAHESEMTVAKSA